MDHRRHVELDHLLVERIPPAIGQRRSRPVAAGRIGIEIAADEAVRLDAALELADAIGPGERPAIAAIGRRRRNSAG